MKAFGIRPNRDLGQNFLIDSNLLDVISRAAELGPRTTSSSRSAAGSASCPSTSPPAPLTSTSSSSTAASSPRCATPSTTTRTRRCTSPTPSSSTSAALTPAPTKVIANLPYGVAATVILRTIEHLPTVTTWVAMVQREVGERFAAGPGTSAYGIPSVLAQLACDVKVIRPVSRNVFFPVPNVDSVLVRLLRREDAEGGIPPSLRALVQQGFAHRRKALPRSVALAGGDRDRVRAALEAIGLPADARAETLGPQQWRELHARLT